MNRNDWTATDEGFVRFVIDGTNNTPESIALGYLNIDKHVIPWPTVSFTLSVPESEVER